MMKYDLSGFVTVLPYLSSDIASPALPLLQSTQRREQTAQCTTTDRANTQAHNNQTEPSLILATSYSKQRNAIHPPVKHRRASPPGGRACRMSRSRQRTGRAGGSSASYSGCPSAATTRASQRGHHIASGLEARTRWKVTSSCRDG